MGPASTPLGTPESTVGATPESIAEIEPASCGSLQEHAANAMPFGSHTCEPLAPFEQAQGSLFPGTQESWGEQPTANAYKATAARKRNEEATIRMR
jgi:hypothetical protein